MFNSTHSDVDELIQDGSQMAIKKYQLVSRHMKTACRVFTSLIHSLEKELAVISEKLYPRYLQHSINVLPDDILGKILELIDNNPFDLGLVSRRFRDLVLRLAAYGQPYAPEGRYAAKRLFLPAVVAGRSIKS